MEFTDDIFVFADDDPGIPEGHERSPFAGLDEAVVQPFMDAFGNWQEAALMERLQNPGVACDHDYQSKLILLGESKTFGSNNAVDDTSVRIRDVEVNANLVLAPNFSSRLRNQRTVARRKFNELTDRAKNDLMELIGLWQDEQLSFRQLQVDSSVIFKSLYENVWQLGRKASAVAFASGDPGAAPSEVRWFRTALREEMGYWQNFLMELRDHFKGKRQLPRFTPEERVTMYVKSLEAMYDSARALALPSVLLFHWIGPKKDDPTICDGCAYMMERSPFTKFNLPAVPRAGSTPCLQNCRHKLMIRKASAAQIARRQAALPQRESMVKRLEEIVGDKRLRKPRGKAKKLALNPYARVSVRNSRGGTF